MTRVRWMWKMLNTGVQHRRKMSMTLKLEQALARDLIDEVTSPRNTVANRNVSCLKQAPDAPIEASPGRFAERPHKLKELLMGKEFRVPNLQKKRNIAVHADRMCPLGVAHVDKFRTESDREAQGQPRVQACWKLIVARNRMPFAPNRLTS